MPGLCRFGFLGTLQASVDHIRPIGIERQIVAFPGQELPRHIEQRRFFGGTRIAGGDFQLARAHALHKRGGPAFAIEPLKYLLTDAREFVETLFLKGLVVVVGPSFHAGHLFGREPNIDLGAFACTVNIRAIERNSSGHRTAFQANEARIWRIRRRADQNMAARGLQ